MQTDSSDNELIARVLRDDDRHAFAQLVRRHQSALRASLRKMTGHVELADDIAQETFILAWKNMRSFRFEARFSTWLYRIAFNAWQSEVRKKSEVLLDPDMPIDDEAVPSHAAQTVARTDLKRAIATLNEGERNAIIQCYYNDLSHEEAAYVLSMPLGTVKTNILKAKQKMRVLLEGYDNDDEGAVA
jgi:RNA polymerase sigma-70 factor, ECF subfamily